jgi:hypothetical protein
LPQYGSSELAGSFGHLQQFVLDVTFRAKYSHHIERYVIHSPSGCHPNRDVRDYADEVNHCRPLLRKMEVTHPGFRGTANHQTHLSNCVAQATLTISLLVRKYHGRQTRQHDPSRNWIYGCLHQPEHHEVQSWIQLQTWTKVDILYRGMLHSSGGTAVAMVRAATHYHCPTRYLNPQRGERPPSVEGYER